MNQSPSVWNIVGHGRAVDALNPSLHTPAHGYLVVGPHHVGKRTLAVEFAKALNCESESVSKPCQMCSACRLIGKNAHPDVSLIEPDGKERISIDQIRRLREELVLLPSQSPFRFVIVRAGAMSDEAADALLKTLEEPNAQVILVLTTHDLKAVPETIVSRCRVITLGFVDVRTIADELERRGMEHRDAEDLASLSYGAPGWAFFAAHDPNLAPRRELIRSELAQWTADSLLARLSAAEALSSASRQPDKTRALVIEELEILMTWWRDVLMAASGQDCAIVNHTSREVIEDAARDQSLAAIIHVLRSIALAASRIDQNVDPRLALEAMAVAV